jgi:DNA-binding transcriptional MerR regulator
LARPASSWVRASRADGETGSDGARRYSFEDPGRLRRIADLVAGGPNVAGVAMVLDLPDENGRL